MNNNSRQLVRTILPGFLAIFFWSMGGYLIFLIKNVPALQVVTFTQLIGGFICMRFEGSYFSLTRLKTRIIKGWPFLGFFLINQICYTYAFQNAPPAHVELLYYTWPVILVVMRSLLLSKQLKTREIIGQVIGFAGLVILVSPDLNHTIWNSDFCLGYLAALMASLGWVGYTLVNQFYDPLKTGFSSIGEDVLIIGTINALLLLISGNLRFLSTTETCVIFIYAIGLYGLAYPLWRIGLKNAYNLTSTMANAIPIISVGWLFIGGVAEMTPEVVTATLLVTASCFLIGKEHPSTNQPNCSSSVEPVRAVVDD